MTPQTIGSALVVLCAILLVAVCAEEYRRNRRWRTFTKRGWL